MTAPLSLTASRCNLRELKEHSGPGLACLVLANGILEGAGAAGVPGGPREDSREKWEPARERGEDEESAREMNRFYRA